MIASTMRTFWRSKVNVESFLNQVLEDEFYEGEGVDKVISDLHQQAMGIKGYLTIQTCAFLDEYKKFHRILPEDQGLNAEAIEFKKGVKKLLKPAIALINNSWKDLYEARNVLFAHNWRKDGELLMFGEEALKATNSPWIDEEFTLLIGIFDLIIYNLQLYRKEFFEEMHGIIKKKSANKVHHRSRVLTHEESLELLTSLKFGMECLQIELTINS